MGYDFSGYATKNDLRCADGRVIRHDAFKDNDGQTVPLVWQHVHSDPTNVLGHALLENRDDGVYAYASFNNTPRGKHAKEMVEHGDVDGKISAFAESCERFQVKVEENYAGSDAVFAGGDFHFAERFLAEYFLDAVADVGFAVVCAYNGKFGRCGNIGLHGP